MVSTSINEGMDVSLRPFAFSPPPSIQFGNGCFSKLPELLSGDRKRILVVRGKRSFEENPDILKILGEIRKNCDAFFEVSLTGEPSADYVDEVAIKFRKESIHIIVGIGGGSVIDFGKAVSAMLCEEGSICQFLEGMAVRNPSGRKVYYIAIPTSSGTGAEATKNAVISQIGSNGFKRSLRHDRYIPDVALVDPTLTLTCPPDITAACGLDALTQLMEAYVSTNANPYTDALCLSGLKQFALGFEAAFEDGYNQLDARTAMSYAALTSGIVLANAGLGVVHGIAGVLGGLYEIPHGVACGKLLHTSTCYTIEALFQSPNNNKTAIQKYAAINTMLTGNEYTSELEACKSLIAYLEQLEKKTNMPGLRLYGIPADLSVLQLIAHSSSNKNNPIPLSKVKIQEILKETL